MKVTYVRTQDNPWKQGTAIIVGIVIAGLLAVAWWPNPDRYRPVQPWERGTLVDAVPATTGMARAQVGVGYRGYATLSYAAGATLPTQAQPQMALVLIPRTTADGAQVAAPEGLATDSTGRLPGSGTTQEGTTGSTGTPPAPSAPVPADPDQTWVFPFDRPLAPGPGDNQAMAVNTTDGGVVYDVAFAMVWVDDGSDVENRNEAYALASCKDCMTLAVAFQVVYVVGQSDVIIPQNIAAAVNYNCMECVTAALAQQLVVTLNRYPSEEVMRQLQALWTDLMAFSDSIMDHSFADIAQKLDDFEIAVLKLLTKDGALVIPSPSAAPSAGPTPTTSTSPTEGAMPSGSPSPTGGPTADGSASEQPASPGPTTEPSPTAGPGSGTATGEPGTAPAGSDAPDAGTSTTAPDSGASSTAPDAGASSTAPDASASTTTPEAGTATSPDTATSSVAEAPATTDGSARVAEPSGTTSDASSPTTAEAPSSTTAEAPSSPASDAGVATSPTTEP